MTIHYVGILLLSAQILSQGIMAFSVSPELIEKERAIIRSYELTIELNAVNELIEHEKVVVTFLNQSQHKEFTYFAHYNPSTKIKDLKAYAYDATGREIEKFKAKDFEDVSAVGGANFYVDDRLKYLNYSPKNYPFTLEIQRTQQFENTLTFGWQPFHFGNINIESASFQFINRSEIPVRVLEKSLDNFNYSKKDSDGGFIYVLKNARRPDVEPYAPHPSNYLPQLIIVPEKFNYEGKTGEFTSWESYGKWYYHNLLHGRQKLPTSLKNKVSELTKGLTNDREKVKTLYQYLQQNSRYVSVQVGIGGLRTDTAENVAEMGYGDCKGLSNLMMSMLHEIGIEANFTAVYGDTTPRSFSSDFPSQQGNHAILHVPLKNDTIWLECTTQTSPFNHLAGFTDYRKALVITPNGGKLVQTQSLPAESNRLEQIIKAKVNDTGKLSVKLSSQYSGFQYNNVESLISLDTEKSKEELLKIIQELKSPKILDFDFNPDWENAEFHLRVTAESDAYSSKAGNFLILEALPLEKTTNRVKKMDNRTMPLFIARPWLDSQEVHWSFPKGMKPSKVPENEYIKSEFGEYSLEFEPIESGLVVRRKQKRIQGEFPPDKFNEFIDYLNTIEKLDHTKIILQ